MTGGPINCCQWPTCPFLAAAQMRRGESMPNMFLCVHHTNQFRAMTNAECRDLAERVEDKRVIMRGNERVMDQDLEEHELPVQKGRRVA